MCENEQPKRLSVGRPTKLTPELTREIAALLLAGTFVNTACDLVGVGRRTFYTWLERGERGWQADIDGGYVEFRHTIKKAVARVEVAMVRQLRSGSPRWKAIAWWLERRYPDRWGKRRRHTISGEKDKPSQVERSGNDDATTGILEIFGSGGAQGQ